MDREPSKTAVRPDVWAFILVPLLYWLGARIGGLLTLRPDDVSMLWPPNAVLIATFLRYGGARWWAFCGLTVLAEVAADLPRITVGEALVYGCANVLEATVAWRLLRAWHFDPRFERVADLGRFVLAAPLVAALVGAVVGASALWLVGGPIDRFDDFVLVWWFGDGLGLMIFTPAYLAWATPRTWEPPPFPSRPLVDVAMSVGGLFILGLLVTESAIGVGVSLWPRLLLPFVLYASIRLNFRYVCLLVMAVAVLFISLTVVGRPPYGLEEPHVGAIWTQEYVLVLSILSLGLSTLLANLGHTEAELSRVNRELLGRATALERNNQELQRIAYVASHDLQTPLRTINSFVQLLQHEFGGRMGPVADDWIGRVTTNARRLETSLRALGDVADVGASSAPFARVDMNAVFDAVVAGLEESIRAAGADVTRDDLPIVRGDVVQLARMVNELLDNALASCAQTIRVSARVEPGEWVFSVRDDGAGIPADQRERVFDLFHRVYGRREGPGGAAGLALCARVVHRHGGRIWVESAPGRGSTFQFSLPRDDMRAP